MPPEPKKRIAAFQATISMPPGPKWRSQFARPRTQCPQNPNENRKPNASSRAGNEEKNDDPSLELNIVDCAQSNDPKFELGTKRTRIHELDATGKVALNSIIQSSNWVPPKADTWTGRNWQGGAQSNNPEFGSGTTEGGYMDWTQLARVQIGYYRKRIHGLDATGKVGPNPIIQSSDWVPPHEWDATGQVVIHRECLGLFSGFVWISDMIENVPSASGDEGGARKTAINADFSTLVMEMIFTEYNIAENVLGGFGEEGEAGESAINADFSTLVM
ncbi:hypothetical protein B0H10DRAFT_1963362 [Mycena sp. CBHHK59/15]|nr:hypothetical protein B0H10DRAFT_1970017 [Mycena sp. CBHHK59/15]KAJ6576788.1 hypothetical protein B0H10DRAFT_1963362 [Mycena sp. CBHHK59/15]